MASSTPPPPAQRCCDQNCSMPASSACRKRRPSQAGSLSWKANSNPFLPEHRPDVCAVEELYAHYAHPRTAILMGPRARRDPTRRRPARRADRAVRRQPHQAVDDRPRPREQGADAACDQATFGLKQLPEPPDVADAIAIALTAALEIQSIRSPQRRRDAEKKII